MLSPFENHEVDAKLRPSKKGQAFDLNQVLSSVVALVANVPPDAATAGALGTERVGNGIAINTDGLILTIGYLTLEASEITLVTNDGRCVAGHPLGNDAVTGFGLVQALEPLNLPSLIIGDSRTLKAGDAVVMAGAGGRSHAVAAQLLGRQPFAGYWEYFLDEALFVGPGHPHWSGAALIGSAGELVGVGSLAMEQRTLGGETSPINMCVPTELLPPILDDLSRGRPAKSPRPWLGLLTQEMADGVVILGVTDGGPADRAQLRAGDRVLAVSGSPVLSLENFYKAVWAQGQAGVDVSLRLNRQGDVFDVVIRSINRASTFKKRLLN